MAGSNKHQASARIASRGLRRVAAVLGAIAMVSTMAGAPAGAFSRDGTSSCGSQVKFAFNGAHWVSGATDTRIGLRPYIYDWEDEYKYNGTQLLDVVESFGELVLEYQPASHFSASGHYGSASTLAVRHGCSSAHINDINKPPSYPPPASWYHSMGHLLQHEIGHGFGFAHTGKNDSHEPTTPIMATCVAFGAGYQIAQDDWQAAQYQFGPLNPEPMSANDGFNRGTSYYATTSGTSWFTGSGGVYWKPTSSGGGYFKQTTSVSESAGDSFDARINWRRTVAGLGGTVYMYMYARGVTYGSGSTCSASNFNSGVDQNDSRGHTSWYLKNWKGVYNSGGVTSSLATLTSPSPSSMSSAFVDIQVRAYHNMRYQSGAYIPLLFDNVRIREQ